jgi:hypothetical protein
MHDLRLLLTSAPVRGEYLRVNAAMQRSLAEAIADRAGIDIDQDMLPMILAGAVTSASQVAVQYWLNADPPRPLRPLLRRALSQLPAAFSAT